VATQSFVEPAYGPKGLALMRQGVAPKDALARLLAADPQAGVRQVAFVDAQGRAAAHTGDKCIPGAGQHVGDGYTTEANLMLTNEVPDAMARAFEAARGPLAERMMAALDAAQGVGGDIRGKQSAAILVVRAKASDKPWTDRIVDLRVEDAAEPLVELRRLLTLHRAYERMNRGERLSRGRWTTPCGSTARPSGWSRTTTSSSSGRRSPSSRTGERKSRFRCSRAPSA
jgi:uncharacterized Ntn-hydrolase superfamily protein